MARGHEALGMIAMARKKYDVAASEFKTATEIATRAPASDVHPHGERLHGRRQT